MGNLYENLPPNVQAHIRAHINNILNGGGFYGPSEPPRVQANRVTAENYATAHPGSAIGYPSDDGQNLQFSSPAGNVFVDPVGATTTVQIGHGRDAHYVTAAADHTLTVSTADGLVTPVANARLADEMVQIGSNAVTPNARGTYTHGLPVISPRDVQTLASDAVAAIGQLSSPSTPQQSPGQGYQRK